MHLHHTVLAGVESERFSSDPNDTSLAVHVRIHGRFNTAPWPIELVRTLSGAQSRFPAPPGLALVWTMEVRLGERHISKNVVDSQDKKSNFPPTSMMQFQ